MLLPFLLFIFINRIIVNAAHDESEEGKFIDLLPEKEKKAFIEKIARRILDEVEVKSNYTKKSQELTDDQLDIHSAYVAKILKEESENLRRLKVKKTQSNEEIKHNSKKKDTESANTNETIFDLQLALKKVDEIEDVEVKKKINKVFDEALRDSVENKELSTTEPAVTGTVSGKEGNINNQSESVTFVNDGSNTNENNSGHQTKITLPEENHSDKIQQNESNNEKETNKSHHIDLTFRSKNNSTQKPNSNSNTTDGINISEVGKQNGTVSIEIEITDKDDELPALRNQIPVKVVYEDDIIRNHSGNKLKVSRRNYEPALSPHVQNKENQVNETDLTLKKTDPQITGDIEVENIVSDLKPHNNEVENQKPDVVTQQVETPVIKSNEKQHDSIKNGTNTSWEQVENKEELKKTKIISAISLDKLKAEPYDIKIELENDNVLNTSQINQDIQFNDKHLEEDIPQHLDEIQREKRTSDLQVPSTETSGNKTSNALLINNDRITEINVASETTTLQVYSADQENIGTENAGIPFELSTQNGVPIPLNTENNTQDKNIAPGLPSSTIKRNSEEVNPTKSVKLQLESSSQAGITMVIKNDTNTQKKSNISTLPETTTKRNLEKELPTVIIPLETENNENYTIETSTINGTTTEEIVKAKIVSVSWTNSSEDESDKETEKRTSINVTQASVNEVATNKKGDKISIFDETHANITHYDNKKIMETSNTSTSLSSASSVVTESNLNETEKNNNETNATDIKSEIKHVSNDFVVELVTSTQITPLTTLPPENEEIYENKSLIFGLEAPAIVINSSVAIASEDRDSITNENVSETTNIAKKALRLGGEKPQLQKQWSKNDDKGMKKYAVFELLPGEKPFQEIKRPANKVSSQHPKSGIPQTLQLKYDHPSQVERPNYATVYNYDPKFAFYNPHNKYEPDDDDYESEETYKKQETVNKYFKETSSQETSNEYYSKKYSRSDTNAESIDIDYYLGNLNGDNDILRQKSGMAKLKCNSNEDEQGVKCPYGVKYIYQNTKVPPNSDEVDHAYNALLYKEPHASHLEQTRVILTKVGYNIQGRLSKKHHKLSKKPTTPRTFPTGRTTMFVPPIDLIFGRLREHDKFFGAGHLRSGSRAPKKQNYKVFNRYNKFVNEKTNQLHNQNHKNKIKKAPLIILTGNAGIAEKHDNFKIKTGKLKPLEYFFNGRSSLLNADPNKKGNKFHADKNVANPAMIILTGNMGLAEKHDNIEIKTGKYKPLEYYFSNRSSLMNTEPIKNYVRLNKKNKLSGAPLVILTGNAGVNDMPNLKIKTGNFRPLEYLFNDKSLLAEPSEKEKTNKLMQKFGELDYDDIDDGKQLKDSNEKMLREVQIPTNNQDSSSQGNHEIENIKTEKVSKGIPISLVDLTKKRHKRLKAYLTVIKDMIERGDNKALKNYNWLGTAVDIRSALTKLLRLSESTRLEKDDIHPKDFQLLKYVLYLYETVNPKFSSRKYNIIRDGKDTKGSKKMRLAQPLDDTKIAWINDKIKSIAKEHITVEKPWLSKQGMTPRLLVFEKFLKGVEKALDDLHEAIKRIADNTKYRSQRWYENLKDLYLNKPTKKKLLEIIFHLTLTRILDIVEESGKYGLADNYVKFSNENPKLVEQATDEFQIVMDIIQQLHKLSR